MCTSIVWDFELNCALSVCFWKVHHGFSFSFCVSDELWLCIYSKITSIQTNFGLNFQIEYGNQKKASMISNIKYLSHVHVLWQIERIFYWKTLSSEAQTILHHYGQQKHTYSHTKLQWNTETHPYGEDRRGRRGERECVHQCKLNLLKQYQIEINVYIENGINDVKVKCPFVLPCVVWFKFQRQRTR